MTIQSVLGKTVPGELQLGMPAAFSIVFVW